MSVFGVSAIGIAVCARATVVKSTSVVRTPSASMCLLRFSRQKSLNEICGHVDGSAIANSQWRQTAGVLYIKLRAVVGQKLNHFVNSGCLWTVMTHGGMHRRLPGLIGCINITTQLKSDFHRVQIGATRRGDERSCRVLCL